MISPPLTLTEPLTVPILHGYTHRDWFDWSLRAIYVIGECNGDRASVREFFEK